MQGWSRRKENVKANAANRAAVRDFVGAAVNDLLEAAGSGQSPRQMDTSASLNPLMTRTFTSSVNPDPSKSAIWNLPAPLSFATRVDGA